MLVSPDDGRVDRHQPLDVARRVRFRLGGPQHPVERAVRRPPAVGADGHGVWPIRLACRRWAHTFQPGPELPASWAIRTASLGSVIG